jgi:UDP-2,4-diacetamido-2,4,6-trideoxy-beta-L-altropyranose hydrolase
VIALRDARFTDCLAVWRWNFAPDVRAVSRTQEDVPLSDHARWFARRLRSLDPVWIVEENGDPVGIVRLDGARISIALAAEVRGRGIGREAIAIACQRANQPVVAEVASENTASRRCFEACGFVPVEDGRELVTYRWSRP